MAVEKKKKNAKQELIKAPDTKVFVKQGF